MPVIRCNPTKTLSYCSPLRDFIWKRDNSTCQECGKQVRRYKADRYDSGRFTGRDLGEIDHIVARADGGLTVVGNLRLLCIACNRIKGGESAKRRRGAA